MKLRDHPLMSHGGLRNWPPIWVCMGRTTRPIEQQEVGTLTEVSLDGLGKPQIMLGMKNDNGDYRTLIDFDDRGFCLKVYERLKDCIGKPVEDLGDLDFGAF